MRRRRWHPRRAWLRWITDETRAEASRLRRSARFQLGKAVLELLRRPWRAWAALGRLADAVGRGAARRGPPVHPPPYPRADWSASSADELDHADADRRGLLTDLALDPAFALGTLIVERRWSELAARLGRRVERAEPAPTRVHPSGYEGSLHVPALTPELRCLGPDWLTEMLAFEEVREAGPDHDGDVLVGLSGSVGGGPLAAAASAHRVVAWVLDDHVRDEWLPLLRQSHRVFVAEPALVSALRERLGRTVTHLAPAVQPRLDNPIGWWSNRPDLAITSRARDARPPAWATLASAARGLALSEAEARGLARALGDPLPSVKAPAWAPGDVAADWSRLARLRAALRRHDLASRLRLMASPDVDDAARRDGPHGSADRGETVSVVFSSRRPWRQPGLLHQLARQTHPDVRVVGVLHGDLPAGHLERLRRQAERSGLRARFLTIPSSRSLGDCVQAGFDASEGDVVVRVDDDDLYGAHFVDDMALALRFSEAGLAFKHTLLLLDEPSGRLAVLNPGCEYCYLGTNAGGGRLAVRRELLDLVSWRPLPTGGDTLLSYECLEAGAPLLAVDRFNHVFVRGRPGRHTWKSSFERITASEPHRVLPREAVPSDFDA